MKHVNLRLPDDVHAKLVVLAKADHHSLNSMIIVLVEAESDRRKQKDH
jgi:predicted HicB family RNase H-like nuclease